MDNVKPYDPEGKFVQLIALKKLHQEMETQPWKVML